MIPIYKPYIPDASAKYVNDAIKSTWISSIGEYIHKTTKKLAELNNCKYVILTNSGTSATHLVTKTLKKLNPDVKRILVPSACYITAYNTLLYDKNNWEIKCIDLNEKTWNMDIKKVRSDDAVFAVHNLGNIINIPNIKKKFGCVTIEDNCEGFFGTYNNIPAGSQSLCSSLSFFGNKNITSGEGGAFLTNNESAYEYALKLRNQGQGSEKYIHEEMGYNYRMTNIQAAILLGQLESIDSIFNNKKRIFERYKQNLNNINGIRFQEIEKNTNHSMWMFGVRFLGLKTYEDAKQYFKDVGIDTRPMFYSYKRHKYLNFSGDDKVANIINNEAVIFPSYPELSDKEIDYICEKILLFTRRRLRTCQ